MERMFNFHFALYIMYQYILCMYPLIDRVGLLLNYIHSLYMVKCCQNSKVRYAFYISELIATMT